MAARAASRFATALSMSAATAMTTSAFSHPIAMSRGVEPATTIVRHSPFQRGASGCKTLGTKESFSLGRALAT